MLVYLYYFKIKIQDKNTYCCSSVFKYTVFNYTV